MKYYGKCKINGALISLKTNASSPEEAVKKIKSSYKVEEVLEISLIPFERKQLFTKHKIV